MKKNIPALAGLAIGISLIFQADAIGTTAQDNSKGIKAEEFIVNRPLNPRKVSTTASRKSSYKPRNVDASAGPPSGKVFAHVGVTIWRLRPSTYADKTKELVEDDEGDAKEYTLERIEEGTPVSPGQKVRLSIESLSRDGYVYVINREQYEDGTLGDPMLIFPTRKSSSANPVRAGRLISIPSSKGKFTIKPSESAKRHVAEAITIIVTSKPLIDDTELGLKGTKLSRLLVESWEQQWGGATKRFEMDGGAGRTMTPIEQVVGNDSAQVLTQEDPPPQTVYRIATKPENPILITVPLKFFR